MIREILTNNIALSSRLAMDALTGRSTSEEVAEAGDRERREEQEIQAVLTPQQQTAYPEFKKKEAIVEADNSANSEVRSMTDDLNLSPQQQQNAYAALYNLDLQDRLQDSPPTQKGEIASFADILRLQIEQQQSDLDRKLMALAGILSPEQLQAYQQEQTNRISHSAEMMRAFVPQTDSQTP